MRWPFLTLRFRRGEEGGEQQLPGSHPRMGSWEPVLRGPPGRALENAAGLESGSPLVWGEWTG